LTGLGRRAGWGWLAATGCWWLVATATATCHALACSAKTNSGQHPNLDFLLVILKALIPSFTPTSKIAFSEVSTYLLNVKIRDDKNKWPRTKAPWSSYFSFLLPPPPPPADKN